MPRASRIGLAFSLLSSCIIVLSLLVPPASAAGSAIYYQGELRSGGEPVTGWYDFEFQLYDTAEGGKPLSAVQRAAQTYVQNGTFALFLDFGVVPDGAAAYVEVGVRPDGSADPYAVLAPRQSVAAVATSDIGLQSTEGETWRLGVNSESGAAYSVVIGRPAGETAAFRSNRDTEGIYFMFPAPATAKTVQSAQFYIIQRTGDYTDAATISLEVYDFDGVLQHQASSSVDAKTAATDAWTTFTLSGTPDDLVVSPGEYVCAHFALGGTPGGDLDVRPTFEIEVQ